MLFITCTKTVQLFLLIVGKMLKPCAPPAGRVGLWKDVFTVSMNDKFESVYRQKMGKSDLTFDFGVWGATSPPFAVPPLHNPHICIAAADKYTGPHSSNPYNTVVGSLQKKKEKKEKTSQRMGVHSRKDSDQQPSLSSSHHSVFPLLCINRCIYKYIYKAGVDHSRFFS